MRYKGPEFGSPEARKSLSGDTLPHAPDNIIDDDSPRPESEGMTWFRRYKKQEYGGYNLSRRTKKKNPNN
jgi:hypothetical protein